MAAFPHSEMEAFHHFLMEEGAPALWKGVATPPVWILALMVALGN